MACHAMRPFIKILCLITSQNYACLGCITYDKVKLRWKNLSHDILWKTPVNLVYTYIQNYIENVQNTTATL